MRLWANYHLLIWLSLTPFGTSCLGKASFSAGPVAVYRAILLFAAVAYFILTRALISAPAWISIYARSTW
jgi:TMEM175 potassium channel family protein